MALVEKLYDAIVDGDAEVARGAVDEQLSAGADPMVLITDSMIPAMDDVGHLYQEEQYFIAELMLSGRAMKSAMEPLRPLLAAAGAKPAGVVVAGAVKGDLHDIGKNLVISMLEGAGFKVIDLGTDVRPEKFVAAIREHNPQIVCLSALLTVTMMAMKSTVAAIEQAGLRDLVKILVGGAPVNERFAREIGADGYGETATDAVTLARQLVVPVAHAN
jgi:corrinoid protein of di/trimethylamine methyltransferase